MTYKTYIALLLLSGGLWSQSIHQKIMGPLNGLTQFPRAGHLWFSIQTGYSWANARYDLQGNEIASKTYYQGDFHPNLIRHHLTLTGRFALSRRFGIHATVPFYLTNTLKMNPGPGYHLPDVPGHTGLGDIQAGLWYIPGESDISRWALGLAYQLNSGESQFKDSDVLPSGSGARGVVLSLAGDFDLFDGVLISTGLTYTYLLPFDENEMEIKPGHPVYGMIKGAYLVSDHLSVEAGLTHHFTGQSTVVHSEWDASNVTAITPACVYQWALGSYWVKIAAGLIYPFRGGNIEKTHELFISCQVVL